MSVYQGQCQSPPQARFAVVVSRYNETITNRLLQGAIETLLAHGVEEDAIDVAYVPGAWEIPIVAARMALTKSYAAILCLGAVIRGETTHDQHINRSVSTALMQIAVDQGVPTLFGVLTCDTMEQAIHRAGGNAGNKGVECAQAALEIADLFTRLPKQPFQEPTE